MIRFRVYNGGMTLEETAEQVAAWALYEDNHLLALVKPAGLLIQGDATGRPNLLDMAKTYIQVRYQKPGAAFLGLVHRLDRRVGGVVVFARTSKAAARLADQFRGRRTEKVYWAVVSGRLDPPEGENVMHLARKGRQSVPAAADAPDAAEARLHYRMLSKGPQLSLVEVRLVTGRRHQIRAQMAALGAPIAGDGLYGSPVKPVGEAIGLWARSLTIDHPTQKTPLTFQAPPPDDWPWLPLK
jgi:23S rRNA pseudouridine1911/1915/1917 synthase